MAAETHSASAAGAADAGSAADREEQTLVGSFTKLDLSPQSPSPKESLQPDNPGETQLAGERQLYLTKHGSWLAILSCMRLLMRSWV